MEVGGLKIPRLPIIAGAFIAVVAFSTTREDLSAWASLPGVTFLLTCPIWWLLPAVIGALFGATVGLIVSTIVAENFEIYGEWVSVLSAVLTMLLVGLFIWLVRFLT